LIGKDGTPSIAMHAIVSSFSGVDEFDTSGFLMDEEQPASKI
jgi:hypothetical protein